MAGGGGENVIAITVGTLAFIIILGTMLAIPSFQQTNAGAADPGHDSNVPSPSSILGGQYIFWLPDWGVNVTPNSQPISDNYWGGTLWYGNPKNVANETEFTDPNYDNHHITVRIIRGNFWYDPSSDLDHKKWNDYIFFDAWSHNYLIDPWWYGASLDEIIDSQVPNTNISMRNLGAYNISMMIITPGLAADFSTDLYGDNYTLYIIQQPQMNYDDFMSILWWIISFDNRWMPSAPFFTVVISALVDVTIALVALRIGQGFIP